MALREETKLKIHQVQGVNFMLAHNYVLNSDEMGLGKTLQAIAVHQAMSLDSKAVIVCPYTLKYNWLNEYKKFTTEKEIWVGLKPAKVNIINYEQLYKSTELFMKADIVIFDEAHYLINEEADRTTYVHRMIQNHQPERLILLTGTPMKERVSDFYSILKLLSYTPIPNNGRKITDKYNNHTKFNMRFSNRESFMVNVKTRKGGSFRKQIVKWSGTKNEKELRQYLKFKYIRRLTKDVIDLPPLIFKEVPFRLTGDKLLEAEFEKFQKGESFNVQSKVKAALLTAKFTADYVKNLLSEGQKPLIVFSDHKEPLNVMESKLKRYKTAQITGEVDVKERQKIMDDFQANKLDVIFLTYGAGSTGVNLTAANNMVLNDESWEASTMSQAFKRFHRIGQTRKCTVHKVIGNRVSHRMKKLLISKNKDIARIIGE